MSRFFDGRVSETTIHHQVLVECITMYEASDNEEDQIEELVVDGIKYDQESARGEIADIEGRIAPQRCQDLKREFKLCLRNSSKVRQTRRLVQEHKTQMQSSVSRWDEGTFPCDDCKSSHHHTNVPDMGSNDGFGVTVRSGLVC
jgi:hypothetical protein